MEEFDSKINLWMRQRLLPRLMPNENESNIKFTISRPTSVFFASDVFFVNVRSDKCVEKSVVVKLPLRNPDVNVNIECDGLFNNEILFYNEIAHIDDKNYPKCYLASDDPIFKSVIVLEDLRPHGYSIYSKKVNVDINYIMAALKAIGRLHAHTYIIKEKEPVKYRKLVKSISRIRYLNNSKDEELRTLMNDRFQRVLRARRDKNRDPEFTKTMCEIFNDTYSNVIMKCVEPIEPLATIVHGDCNMNNLLYSTTDNGKIKAILIDFGLLMHSTPAIDIASFLYMSCKREDIRDRSEELFIVYHDSLTECMKEYGIWDSKKYSRQIFWQDYRNRAISGYLSAAVFFRYFMIICEHSDVIPECSEEGNNRFFESDEGHVFMDELIDMLDDLRIAGMLDNVFEICK